MSEGYNYDYYNQQQDYPYQGSVEEQYYYQTQSYPFQEASYPPTYVDYNMMPAANYHNQGYYVEPVYEYTNYEQEQYQPFYYNPNQRVRGHGYRGRGSRGRGYRQNQGQGQGHRGRADGNSDNSERRDSKSENTGNLQYYNVSENGTEMTSHGRGGGARPKQSYQAQRAERAQRGHMSYHGQRSQPMVDQAASGQSQDVSCGQHSYSHQGYRGRGKGQARGHHQRYDNRKDAEGAVYSKGKHQEGDVNSSSQAEGSHSSSGSSAKGSGQPGRGRGSKQKYSGKKTVENDETQRGSLIEQLSNNSYECMVCCDIVRREVAVWSCHNCYHVFHLRCIKKWARSPTALEDGGQGWRCPACQNVTEKVPNQYRCFCGKVRDPDWNRFETPHSCAEVCGRGRTGDCPHQCNILCHPGPCPPCQATVNKSCNCGKIKKTVPCGQAASLKCEAQCQKTLNCGKHECTTVCHTGGCDPCDVVLAQTCFCSKKEREVTCGSAESFSSSFSCEEKCLRDLDCGNHECDKPCHPGSCDGCKLLPSAVTHCPCGHTPLTELTEPGEERKECTDPLPTCDQICGKPLGCGPPENPHLCRDKCHPSDCGPCSGQTEVVCRCGLNTKELPCVEAKQFTEARPFTCEKRCHKKKLCGRHKCSQLCCIDKEHKCDLICGGKLTCGLHRCEEPCHRGNCPTCWQVNFQEVKCYCGESFLEPPVPCGTRPPDCHNTCTRKHACSHPVRHNCHSEEKCPPCTELTVKWCMGNHLKRKNLPCHVTDISCGMTCNKELSCRKHKCQRSCHKSPCTEEGEQCSQPCPDPREACDHPCGAPCHTDSPCPVIACRAEVLIKCECGHRSEKAVCLQGGSDFQRMEASTLAMQISRAQSGEGISIASMNIKKKPKKLECDSECAIMERNRRLALALEIKHPDISSKLGTPGFNQFLKDYAKQNLSFVSEVERQLSDLVHMAEKSKQLKRSHAFPAMNRDQRRVVHELAECYGCETVSYDHEPKKNVVATAYKNRCWHPSLSLTSMTARELPKTLKAPAPIAGRSAPTATSQTTEIKSAWTALGSSSTWASRKPATGAGTSSASANSASKTTKPEAPVIDYFDMTD